VIKITKEKHKASSISRVNYYSLQYNQDKYMARLLSTHPPLPSVPKSSENIICTLRM